MTLSVDERVAKNEEAVSKVTASVDKLAFMFEQTQKIQAEQKTETRDQMNKLITQMEQTNEKLSSVLNLKESHALLKQEVDGLPHKFDNIKANQTQTADMIKDINNKMTERDKDRAKEDAHFDAWKLTVDTVCNEYRDNKNKALGASATVKLLWTIGAAVAAIAGFVIGNFM